MPPTPQRSARVDAAFDLLVVGAGVVGLSVALAAARCRPRWRIGLLERHRAAGLETSSRNSGVLHAGLHGPQDSLKRRLCIEGRQRLVHFCRRHGVAHAVTGKLVVAHDAEELTALERLAAEAERAGAGPLHWWDAPRVRREEPSLRAVAALHVARSGLVDPHGLVQALLAELRRAEVLLGFAHRVRRIEEATGGGLRLAVETEQGERLRLAADRVVGCAGLGADELARAAGLRPERLGLAQRLVAGRWFRVEGRGALPTVPLVYPLPPRDGLGLGLHLTRGLDGRRLLGPDAQPLERCGEAAIARGYAVADSLRPRFEAGLRRLLHRIDGLELYPEGAGIRPRRATPPGHFPDFAVAGPEIHGLAGYLHLSGIESPGLTACLALGEHVAERLRAL